MLVEALTKDVRTVGQAVETFELVIVGAGVAGLNALYAANGYLPKGSRVLLIDQKLVAGGMWNTAYDYVRLHQPHPVFTVGDMRWNWRKPRDYLATRDEVRDHLASALTPLADTLDLAVEFGQTTVACTEVQTDRGHRARITFHPNGTPGQVRTVEAVRAIYAPGLNYREAEPLALSSSDVTSIIPHTLRETLSAKPGAAVYVVGGGKTGMDTVLAVLAQDSGRRLTLINGPGTNFLNRTKFFPIGLKRWTSGALTSRFLRDLAISFDGNNEGNTIAHFRQKYSTDPGSQNGVFLYGFQSEDEHARIAAGLSQTHADYLVDVVDGPDGPIMELRSGARQPVEPGSVFVNCTGSFFRAADMADEATCLSPNKTVLSISTRDGFHLMTSVAGFLMTHLLYRDALAGKGFYTLDHEALFRLNRNAWVGASAAQAYMNQIIVVQTLPIELLDRCGLDLDRWYPLPRRLVGLLRLKATATKDIEHCKAAMDRVAERFNIHCGPIE